MALRIVLLAAAAAAQTTLDADALERCVSATGDGDVLLVTGRHRPPRRLPNTTAPKTPPLWTAAGRARPRGSVWRALRAAAAAQAFSVALEADARDPRGTQTSRRMFLTRRVERACS